jgi:hypothetical protein
MRWRPTTYLAAGLQFSGFNSVVGTLWEVDDSVAKHVVKAFSMSYCCHLVHVHELLICDALSSCCTNDPDMLLRSSYLVSVYSVVFLSTRMFTKVLVDSTRVRPRLLFQYLDSGNRLAPSSHTRDPSISSFLHHGTSTNHRQCSPSQKLGQLRSRSPLAASTCGPRPIWVLLASASKSVVICQ